MKRGTPDHPKMDHLSALLEIPRYAAVGIVESVWHLAQQYAKRGDIGKFAPEVIARKIDWRGESDTLVHCLWEAGWLDRCRCHGLRLHDWPDHADQTVSRSEEVKRLGFLGCYSDASSVLAPDERDASQPSLALPTPSRANADAASTLLAEPQQRASRASRAGAERKTTAPGGLSEADYAAVRAWCADVWPAGLEELDARIEEALGFYRARGDKYVRWSDAIINNLRANENRRRERQGEPKLRSRVEARKLRKALERKRREVETHTDRWENP